MAETNEKMITINNLMQYMILPEARPLQPKAIPYSVLRSADTLQPIIYRSVDLATGSVVPPIVDKVPDSLDAAEYPCETSNSDRQYYSKSDIEYAVYSAAQLGHEVYFQAFNSYHKEVVEPLITVLYAVKLKQIEEILKYAETKKINESAMQYIIRQVMNHRPDVLQINAIIPAHITVTPQMYFDLGDVDMNVEQVADKLIGTVRQAFDYDEYDRDVHNLLASYFYNDPGLNAHHKHWHEAYPDQGEVNGRQLDRMGELFFYMHHQMVARYQMEQLSLHALFVKPIVNLSEPIEEAYFNTFISKVATLSWDSRPAYTKLQDIKTAGMAVRIQDLELWRSRIYDAIDQGFIYLKYQGAEVKTEPLNRQPTEEEIANNIPVDTGINTLGALMVATGTSKNRPYYGNLHNAGHVALAYSHDPIGYYYKHTKSGPMAMTETACRDPAFWRWHMFVDEVLNKYKSTLPEYTEAELAYTGIQIKSAVIKTKDGDTNSLNTQFASDKVDITKGIPQTIIKDITMENVDKIEYEFIHLSHKPFEYTITVNNNLEKTVNGMVRIFLLPTYTDYERRDASYRSGNLPAVNEKIEPYFNKHRRMAIELDKFERELVPGLNTINQKSEDSSLTIPLKQLFVSTEDAAKYNIDAKNKLDKAWCGCGWPEYLLISKGNEEGLPCRIFIMITDSKKDEVLGVKVKDCPAGSTCPKVSASFCGLRDQLYPDRKPMGFPFDRTVKQSDAFLKDFCYKDRKPNPNGKKEEDKFGNMFLIEEVKIFFKNNSADFIPKKEIKA